MATPNKDDDVDLMKVIAARAESFRSHRNSSVSSKSNMVDGGSSPNPASTADAEDAAPPSRSNSNNASGHMEYCDKEHQLEIQDLRERAQAQAQAEAKKIEVKADGKIRNDRKDHERMMVEMVADELMLDEKKRLEPEQAHVEKRQKVESTSESPETTATTETADENGSSPATNHDMVPGAWAFSGTGSSPEPNPTDLSSNEETYDVEANTGGLAVATLAEDDASLPQAEQFDQPETGQHDKTKQLKKRIAIVALFLPTIALVIVIALVLSLTKSGSDDDSDEAMTPQDSSSNATIRVPIDLEEHVKNLLPEESLRAIVQTDSPQARAFQWIVEDQNLLLLPNERIRQRYALATLYHATNGDEWDDNDHWMNHNTHECSWFGQGVFAMKHMVAQFYPGYLSEFFPPTEAPPAPCDAHGHYANLWLDKNNLVGSLPYEIYTLTTLKTLSVGFNKLKWGISSHIGQLTSLEGASFANMQDAGEIPSELGLLSNLKALSLSNSNHQGSIPKELWQLTNMETLALSFNKELKGTLLSEIANMSKLKMFAIAETSLTGSIPTEIGLMENTLEWIALGGNSLTGQIPSELGLLTNMLLFSAYENMLTGSIPTTMGELTLFEYFIALRGNMLSGPIPSELGRLTSLKLTLNLHDNHGLVGAIPSELGLLGALQDLSLDNNALSGPIPSELGLLSSLGMLGLANNTLSGTVPQALATLKPLLHTLRLEGNALLSGVVPEDLCDLNATCTGHSLYPCQAPYGLTFDCSDLLCGCGCSCENQS